MRGDFLRDGYVLFDAEPSVERWAAEALPLARAAMADPAQAAQWVCAGTWFVGVDALDNDAQGRVGNIPLTGACRDFADGLFGALPLHRAQVSVIREGYPHPRDGESAGAFAYRQKRDAAHVDGLLPIGPERKRMIKEPHAWVMGLPLNAAAEGASPMVLWRGSHHIMRAAFAEALSHYPPSDWAQTDLTEAYQAARRTVFERCARVALPAQPGQAYLLDRHLLHGVAPWNGPKGLRAIAYFRPQLPETLEWLGDSPLVTD